MTVLEHIYRPRGGCKEIFELRQPEILISGPAGTGKSRACLEKLHMMCLRNPGMRGLIVRKTLSSLGSTALVTWRNYVAKEAMATNDVVYYGGSSQEAAQYRYRNGSTITIGGMDRPSRIMSSEYDMVYVQEATELTVEDIEIINTRLRNWETSFQQLIMDCNPTFPQHWLKLRCNERKTKLVESRHEDNPVLFDEDGNLTEKGKSYIEKLDRLTGPRYKRLRLGLWVSAEGIIYEEFDPAIHIVPQEEIPDDWSRYWVVDFGYIHPFVCQFWAEDPTDRTAFLYREIYHTRRTVQDHAEQILELVTELEEEEIYNHLDGTTIVRTRRIWKEPKPKEIICDHDAEGRATLERALGMGTVAADKNVSEGIQQVQEDLKDQGNGYARFYIMEDALVERDPDLQDEVRPTCTTEEFTAYVWKTSGTGSKTKVQDEPNKEYDDGMDCLRYYRRRRSRTGPPRLRSLG